jgi:hypothetical protein
MTPISLQVRAFILKAIVANEGPMRDADLKDAIRTRFNNIAFTDDALNQHIQDRADHKLIAGIDDPTDGKVWDLTPGGKIKAQQLR